jgi:hypothetical protein
MCGHCVEGARREQAHQVRSQESGPPGSFSPGAQAHQVGFAGEPSPPGSFSESIYRSIDELQRIKIARLEGFLREALVKMEDYQAGDEDSSRLAYCRWCSTNGAWEGNHWRQPFEHAPDCIVVRVAAAVPQETEKTASEAEVRHERLLNGEPPT